MLVACNQAAHQRTPVPVQTITPDALSTPRPFITLTLPALSLHYISSQIPIQFDYTDGWTAQEYQAQVGAGMSWVLLSNQPAFFADPLDPANTGAIIGVVSWTKIVKLDAAVMTPDPPRFTKVTPDPEAIADTIGFYSQWSQGYCLGTGCLIDLCQAESILLDGRRAAFGHGSIYLCQRNRPTPEGVSACELDIFGVIIETTIPDVYMSLYAKGDQLSRYEALFLEIAATLSLR